MHRQINVRQRRRSSLGFGSRGFTVIELVLAMAISAFVAILAINGINTAITAAERHGEQAQMIADIQLPLTVMERDIRYALNRSIRDEYGNLVMPMEGGGDNEYLLRLTRSGWDNPRGLRRGEIQRVRYLLEDETLWRESWSVLDRVAEEDGQRRTELMTGVVNFEIAFCDDQAAAASTIPIGCEWVGDWGQPRLPRAVEIKFEREGFGEVRRVYSLVAQ